MGDVLQLFRFSRGRNSFGGQDGSTFTSIYIPRELVKMVLEPNKTNKETKERDNY